MSRLPIYLDNQATTRCDPRVVEKMLPYFSEHYGNAASKSHAFGWRAEAAVDLAREQVAACIGAATSEIVFCSGATEANNLALRGAALAQLGKGRHLVLAATEHASVLDCARALEREGWELSLLPVDQVGRIDPGELEAVLRPETSLVSIMLANNEIGVLQDVAALSRAVHDFDSQILFHCDAVQAVGKIEVDVAALGVDLLTLSAHKIYGPKGVGALWRRRRPRLPLVPLIVGGGHEAGLRSGTLPVPLVVGFGVACQLAQEEGEADAARVTELTELLLEGLREELPELQVNGSTESRVAGNLNLYFPGVLADRLLAEVRQVAMSAGSACSSASARPSHVLSAMFDEERARSSLRLSIGRFTTREEILSACKHIVTGVKSLG